MNIRCYWINKDSLQEWEYIGCNYMDSYAIHQTKKHFHSVPKELMVESEKYLTAIATGKLVFETDFKEGDYQYSFINHYGYFNMGSNTPLRTRTDYYRRFIT